MDRVVLRAPTSGRGAPPSPTLPSAAAAMAAVAVFLAAAALAIRVVDDDDDDDDVVDGSASCLLRPWRMAHRRRSIFGAATTPTTTTTTTTTMPVAMMVCATMSTMAALLVARMASSSSSRRLLRRWRRRSLVEAAVEISPLGVQLVSVRGIPSSTAPGVEDATSSPSSCGDCCHPGYEGDVVRVVHAFLPKSSIIDVVVLEVVWPHCVWSHVVFRVLDNNGPDDDYDDGSASSGDRSVRNLLRKGRVIVVPAFYPHECRGMLTYEQCLRVRDEVEVLLGKVE